MKNVSVFKFFSNIVVVVEVLSSRISNKAEQARKLAFNSTNFLSQSLTRQTTIQRTHNRQFRRFCRECRLACLNSIDSGATVCLVLVLLLLFFGGRCGHSRSDHVLRAVICFRAATALASSPDRNRWYTTAVAAEVRISASGCIYIQLPNETVTSGPRIPYVHEVLPFVIHYFFSWCVRKSPRRC